LAVNRTSQWHMSVCLAVNRTSQWHMSVFGSESYLAVAYECVFMFVLNICQSEYCLTMSMFL